MAPLDASSLRPNRALQDEVLEQLQAVLEQAEHRGDTQLAEAARKKMLSVGSARATTISSSVAGESWLDCMSRVCMRCISWCGIMASEQAVVFATSFGTLLCLASDVRLGLIAWRSTTAGHSGPGVGALVATDAKKPPLLLTLIQLVLCVQQPPANWRQLDRLTLTTLRAVILTPTACICSAFVIGAFLALARFMQRCREVQAIERLRASQNQRFVQFVHACTAATGFSSLVLFLRLRRDRLGK
eukprot:CAMPEP_0170607666 /NCGR_PEP_ID=MMETSP0224-20130122/21175_1 /TAXON_ID=285029 /ORGANISM="Togula jolla, Strain CCCM 725" /LENGTH=243 /DNA_ID=CAMNT_0010932845 /DNA_START=219 /DNA_END=950 /DNA_ORIENTATION=+